MNEENKSQLLQALPDLEAALLLISEDEQHAALKRRETSKSIAE
jgi:hypothetical protein